MARGQFSLVYSLLFVSSHYIEIDTTEPCLCRVLNLWQCQSVAIAMSKLENLIGHISRVKSWTWTLVESFLNQLKLLKNLRFIPRGFLSTEDFLFADSYSYNWRRYFSSLLFCILQGLMTCWINNWNSPEDQKEK